MSFPPGTEMFQFPGFASTPYVFRCRYPHGWVSPFGNPRINDCSHLPAAYRSVPRPSSPLGAKASTERSYRAQYIPPMPARRTKPHDAKHQLTKLTDSASLIHSRVHDTAIPHKALAPYSTADLVTNQSDSPVKHHASRIRSQRNPSPGDKPVVQQHSTQSGMPKRALNQPDETFGDGRYRTDGPLLAKQVLYH